MLTEGSCGSGTGDSPSITDKSRPCVGRSLSVPCFGSVSGSVSVRRQARGLRSLSAATGRKIRGHQRKTFPSHPPRPRPHPCQKLPDILQGRAHGKIAGTREREREREKKATKRIIFIVIDGAIIRNSFHIKTTRRSLGKKKSNDYTRS